MLNCTILFKLVLCVKYLIQLTSTTPYCAVKDLMMNTYGMNLAKMETLYQFISGTGT